MFLQKISVKYTCTLVRIYTNTHIPINTYTLTMFICSNHTIPSAHQLSTYILDIYILTPALVTLEDGLKGRNQTATTKILTHTTTYKIKMPTRTARSARSSKCVINISCATCGWSQYIYIYPICMLIAGEWKESYVLNINMIKV